MRFVVDAQLPPALVRLLAGAGHEAVHVMDLGLAAAPDAAIWDHALKTHAAIITKDEDFAQRLSIAGEGPPVVWLRVPNTRRQQLLDRFERVFPAIVAALERGERLVEVV